MSNYILVATLLFATSAFAQPGKQASPPAKPIPVVKPENLYMPPNAQLEKRVSELEKELKDLKENHEWLSNYAIEQISNLQSHRFV